MADFSPPDRNAPQLDLYIREALPIDVAQITKIFNHYQQESVYVSERELLTENQVQARLTDVQAEHCAFLVAVERTLKNRDRRFDRNGDEVRARGEKILGFAYTDMICSNGDMWQATGEAEIFIHKDFLARRIAKNLLTRLLQQHDEYYIPNEWAEYRPSYSYKPRPFVNIQIIVPYASGEEEDRPIWVGHFLQEFGFEHVGTFKNRGAKHGKWVSDVTFMRRNGGDPKPHFYSIPMVMA